MRVYCAKLYIFQLPIFSNVVNRATINCARITDVDVKTCGSVVHIIDKVMIPPTETIYDIITKNEKYSIINKIINGTDVEEILKNNSLSITFLAPTDEALEQVSEKDIDNLVNNKRKASEILKNHILKGNTQKSLNTIHKNYNKKKHFYVCIHTILSKTFVQ